jgi:cation transport ATPase
MILKKRNKIYGIVVLLVISLILTLITGIILKETVNKLSKDYIEFVIGLSITLAGFGLVAFQIGKTADELRKDFIESSILMILSALFGIFFWVKSNEIFGTLSSIFFLWGIMLLLLILINERFNLIR